MEHAYEHWIWLGYSATSNVNANSIPFLLQSKSTKRRFSISAINTVEKRNKNELNITKCNKHHRNVFCLLTSFNPSRTNAYANCTKYFIGKCSVTTNPCHSLIGHDNKCNIYLTLYSHLLQCHTNKIFTYSKVTYLA